MTNTLYDRDFHLWIENTIAHLQNQDFQSLDIQHLIEELQDLSKAQRNALVSNLMILLTHLLKLKIQPDAPDMMRGSWYGSSDEHRQRILQQLEDIPSLKPYLTTAIEKAYPKARKLAIKEGKRAKFGVSIPPERNYPLLNPFSIEQILDEDFYG